MRLHLGNGLNGTLEVFRGTYAALPKRPGRELRSQMESVWYDYRLTGKLRDKAPLACKDNVERLVVDSSMPCTILRSNFRMENSSAGFVAASIRKQNAIFLPAATKRPGTGHTRAVASTA